MEGFVVLDHEHRRAAAEAALAGWLDDGTLRAPLHEVMGLENAPAALIGLLAGANIGKAMVRVA
jgi:NADPH-dependent curcumin reductase CurA